jgi:hypothetical protein
MFIKFADRTESGWTLFEMMVAVCVFSICSLALASLSIFASRSMAAMYNYSYLDQENRQAMDTMTAEIRQANQVTAYSSNSITILNGNNENVTYSFTPQSKQLVRTDNATGERKPLLNGCSLLSFSLYQRNPSNGNYGIFPAATNNWQQTVKVLQLTWKTSLTICPTARINSESVQTARIVIRKQQD